MCHPYIESATALSDRYMYMCVCAKKIVIERNRDQFVATDFFLKLAPVLEKTPVQSSPCHSAVSALLTNPLPDSS